MADLFDVKMSTLEKLFVQIFERKNEIIEQVKQQTDLYYKHLASKYLIHGIPPPFWLWNPNFHSFSRDPKGFGWGVDGVKVGSIAVQGMYSLTVCSQAWNIIL